MTPAPVANEALDWIVGVLWGELPGVSVSRVSSGSRNQPATSGAVERYLVVPNARRPRMLLPADRPGGAAALAAGNRMRRPGAKAERWAAGLAVRSGTARLIFRDSIEVAAEPSGVTRTLVSALAELLGEPVELAINVRAAGPYRKPVIQVLSHDGRTLAYAKVAWNDVTERNVAAESDALEAISSARLGLSAPRVRARLSWRAHTVLVTDPMPAGLDRYPVSLGPPSTAVTRAVAGLWPGSKAPLAESDYSAKLADRIGRAASAAPDASSAALQMLDRIRARFADVAIDHGSWHGDWAPWNLGRENGGLWAWDWEYARPGVPLGFDLPHWFFQRSFVERKSSFLEGVVAARAAATPLRELGLTSSQVEATLALHGLEAAARYLDAMVLGAVPNTRFVTGSIAGLASILPELGRA
jgi:hypothetical protein